MISGHYGFHLQTNEFERTIVFQVLYCVCATLGACYDLQSYFLK